MVTIVDKNTDTQTSADTNVVTAGVNVVDVRQRNATMGPMVNTAEAFSNTANGWDDTMSIHAVRKGKKKSRKMYQGTAPLRWTTVARVGTPPWTRRRCQG